MRVLVIALLLALLPAVQALAGDQSGTEPQLLERPPEHAPLVDEDEDFAQPEQTYAFNPVQAKKEFKVGNHYFKKGSYAAAATRYEEATRWDSSFAAAYWRLGLSRERLESPREALAAYTQFLALATTGKQGREARRKIAQLEQVIDELPLAGSGAQPEITE